MNPRIVTFALAVLLAAGCAKQQPVPPAGAGPALTKVRLQTDWFPQPEHGGYYQALAKGFYSAEGLEVEIVAGGPNAQVMATVATGRAQFGMTNGDDVITAVSRGVPVVMVAAEMQRDAQGVMFHESHPLRSLRDLDGKTLMAGAGSTWLTVMQRQLGIRFHLQPLVGDLARFMNDEKFIQQCFVTSEPYFARQRGAQVGALLIANAEAGFEPYRVVLTSREFAARQPEIVRKFVRATLRGWIDYLTGDPEPANALLRKLRPDLPEDFYAYSIRAMKDYQLVLGDAKRGEAMGQLTAERLQRQIEQLQAAGVLEKAVTVGEVASFEFLPDGARARQSP